MSDTDDLRELYQDMILDHGRHPRNFHKIEDAQCEAVGHNPLCGDKLVLYIKMGADDKIENAGFQGEGCAISVASASLMTDMLIGKNKTQAEDLWAYFKAVIMGEDLPDNCDDKLDEEDIDRLAALSGVKHYPVRIKCATLAWRTFEAAIQPDAPKKVGTE